MQSFYVYILKCVDDSYYIGHTDNIEKRFAEHMLGECKTYTSTRLPVEMVFLQDFATRDEAINAEYIMKKWTRKKKEALIKTEWHKLRDLARKRFK